MSGSGLSLSNLRTEADVRAQLARGCDPASIYDPSQDFYEDVTFTMKPGYRSRRRTRAARWIIGTLAGACLTVCALICFVYGTGLGR